MFFEDILKIISTYDSSNSSDFSFYDGGNILKFLFCTTFYIFFPMGIDARLHKATYLSLFFRSILSERLNNSHEVLLFLEFINIVSILYCTLLFCIEFIELIFFSNFFHLIQRICDLTDLI